MIAISFSEKNFHHVHFCFRQTDVNHFVKSQLEYCGPRTGQKHPSSMTARVTETQLDCCALTVGDVRKPHDLPKQLHNIHNTLQ